MIENEIENNAEPASEERDSQGRRKRRWGYSRESRARLKNIADQAESQITTEHRLRLLWTENFEALDQATQADLRQRESHVLYLTGCMLLFLDRFAKNSTDLLPAVCEPCSTFLEVEEYLEKFPLVTQYIPDCPTFAAVFSDGTSANASGFDLDSQKIREAVPCDGYRNYGLRLSLGGGSWPDVVDVNGAGLHYRFMFGLDDYCRKHKSEVDPHVAKAAKEFVASRIKPSTTSTATARPVTPAPSASPTAAILGWVEPVSSTVEREMQLNDKIRSDVRESLKKFQEDLQGKL